MTVDEIVIATAIRLGAEYSLKLRTDSERWEASIKFDNVEIFGGGVTISEANHFVAKSLINSKI